MEKRSRASEDALDTRTGQHLDVTERIDSFDAEFPKRFVAQTAVRAVHLRGDLMIEPVHGWVPRRPRALGNTGVFGEIETDVYRPHRADGACLDLLHGMQHARPEVAVPRKEFDSAALDFDNQALGIGSSMRHRLVLHDVLAEIG